MTHHGTLTPDQQWLLSLRTPRPLLHRLRDALRVRFLPSLVLDLWPDPDGVIRGPDGRPWIPTVEPTTRTGPWGWARRRDWVQHATCAQSQTRALARRATELRHRVDGAHTPTLINAAQASAWAGRPLTTAELARLADAIPETTIPAIVRYIVDTPAHS